MSHERLSGFMDDPARALRARGACTRDLVDEVRDHLTDRVEAGTRRGPSAVAAEDEALTNT
jgi:hypothetical protein